MKRLLNYVLFGALLCGAWACQKEQFVAYGEGLEDWSASTHQVLATPNYDVVFDPAVVHQIHVVFSKSEWRKMQNDLQDVVGGNSGGAGGTNFSDQTPLYFPADVIYNGVQWYNVGVRYKGNSSLSANTGKLPFRFEFDRFEDEFPEITDQRFYGFKELSFSSGMDDRSLMREKTAADLFRSFGVPAVRTAFYEIYVDQGTGTFQYFGLYTLGEVVFDSFLQDYFGSNTGSCYKPDGDGASFAASGFDLNDFEIKTDATAANRCDVQAMFDALHDGTRTSDPGAWRSGLEAVFDVDGFLRYLAANNTIQNWDTYGNMTHNYYLYNDPATEKLRWIVWDNNEAFGEGKGRNQALSFPMDEVGEDWPLIAFLMADSNYEETYKYYVDAFITGPFAASEMSAVYAAQQDLLSTSASNEEQGYTFLTSGVSSFNSAVSTLISHNQTRIDAASDYTN